MTIWMSAKRGRSLLAADRQRAPLRIQLGMWSNVYFFLYMIQVFRKDCSEFSIQFIIDDFGVINRRTFWGDMKAKPIYKVHPGWKSFPSGLTPMSLTNDQLDFRPLLETLKEGNELRTGRNKDGTLNRSSSDHSSQDDNSPHGVKSGASQNVSKTAKPRSVFHLLFWRYDPVYSARYVKEECIWTPLHRCPKIYFDIIF